MIKKVLTFTLFASILSCTSALAESKIAVVDLQKVVANSSQVKALKKEQDAKRKELAQFIKKAGEDIQKQTDIEKKKTLAQKYDKEFAAKREANAKAYKTKLEAIDKSISNTISQQAKTLGYDMVITKGVVLYGGEDITDKLIKIIK